MMDHSAIQKHMLGWAGLGWSMLKASLWKKEVKDASHYNLLDIVT
jgi:hypothetical protein